MYSVLGFPRIGIQGLKRPRLPRREAQLLDDHRHNTGTAVEMVYTTASGSWPALVLVTLAALPSIAVAGRPARLVSLRSSPSQQRLPQSPQHGVMGVSPTSVDDLQTRRELRALVMGERDDHVRHEHAAMIGTRVRSLEHAGAFRLNAEAESKPIVDAALEMAARAAEKHEHIQAVALGNRASALLARRQALEALGSERRRSDAHVARDDHRSVAQGGSYDEAGEGERRSERAGADGVGEGIGDKMFGASKPFA